jgi:hypothetical protein
LRCGASGTGVRLLGPNANLKIVIPSKTDFQGIVWPQKET